MGRARVDAFGPVFEWVGSAARRFLLLEGVGGPVCERSHVFSSFFYKQLSRRRAAGENDVPSVP